MRCNDFDAHIDEMLSGILHPDASQHMTHCERCNSHYRVRATVQSGLRKLASATASGPSRATDRAVIQAYRALQQRRAAELERVASPHTSSGIEAVPAPRVLMFTNLAPVWASRTWWTGAAAAALVFAVLGSSIHLWNGVPTVSAPTVASAPAGSAETPRQMSSRETLAASSAAGSVANSVRSKLHHSAPASTLPSNGVESGVAIASSESPSAPAQARPVRRVIPYGETSNYESSPVTDVSTNVVRLASTGTASNVAQSASSTWPGYSNLMYCDPVVCSGPMQVVHIKVPVGQVKPNLGQTVGNAFVNAEVVIGPDGVARAIRVAN